MQTYNYQDQVNFKARNEILSKKDYIYDRCNKIIYGDPTIDLKKCLPPFLQENDFKNFDFTVSESYSLLKEKLLNWDFKMPPVCSLFSKQTGIGKTHLATALAKKYIWDWIYNNFENEKEYIENGLGIEAYKNIYEKKLCSIFQKPQIKFILATDLLSEIREAYSDKKTESQIINDLYQYDLLILDDIYTNKNKDFTNDIIFPLIDKRSYQEGKTTIITSNAEIDSIDFRIQSRLDNSMMFQIDSQLKDFRKLV